MTARQVALAAVLVLACAGASGRAGSDAERQEWSAAMALASRDPKAGAAALAEFVRAHPKSAFADDAAIRLAALTAAAGDEARATRQLEWVLANHAGGDQVDRARLALAQLERARGDDSGARGTARRIRVANLTPDERRAAERLLADLAADAKDPADELRWLGDLRAEGGPGTEDVDARIDAVLAALSPELLDSVASALGRRPVAAHVRIVQSERALARGDRDLAERAIGAARRLPLTPADAEALVALETRLAEKPAPAVDALALLGAPEAGAPPDPFVPTAGLELTLGVVLPLSGSAASFGEEALQGVLLAAGAFDGAAAASRGPRLVIRDSRGQAAAASDAVRELAAEPGLVAIVGPLLPEEAEAAAAAAQEAGVPLVSLSRREGLGRGRPLVIRAGTSPKLEAELLADHAVRTLGLRRFAILYPEDAFGRALRAAFWGAVEARGGEVVAVSHYPLGATDFAAPIRRMIGYELLPPEAPGLLAAREKLLKRAKRLPYAEAEALREEARALTLPSGEPLPPYIDFEALFIPDAHSTAGLIAPHLAFHEVQGVRLLGPSTWNHPGLLRLGGRHVEGAIFPGAYHPAVAAPNVVAFAARYEGSFAAPPTSLAAEAFDAANLVLAAAAGGADERASVLAAIAAEPRRVGVSGVLQLGGDGELARRPHLLGVAGGQVVCLDEVRDTGAPASP